MIRPLFILPAVYVLLFSTAPAQEESVREPAEQRLPDIYNVLEYGAKPDGETDATAAFQAALDAASRARGGIVHAPRGLYLFRGHLSVPSAVTLRGVWVSVPAHNGIRDRGLPKPTDDGTTFLVTEGAGSEDGAPFITLGTNSTLTGVVVYYPRQKTDDAPDPYPWAIAMRGKNPAVLNVELLNAYNGIDASQNERHLIRNVHGQPLRRGVFVDAIYDIGRIENVHFNPWWSMKPKLFRWQMENGEAFVFGRSDWEYVHNTFCFGYNVGYRFTRTRSGVCNGNFLGLGADDCYTAVVVDECAPYGLLFTNGQFVSFHGPDPTSSTALSGDRVRRPAIRVESGTVLVRGCEFRHDAPQVELGKDVRRAVITSNIFTGATRIANKSEGNVQIANNVDG